MFCCIEIELLLCVLLIAEPPKQRTYANGIRTLQAESSADHVLSLSMGAFHVPLHNNNPIIISHRVTRPITINDVPKYITVAVAQVNNIIVIIVILMVKE